MKKTIAVFLFLQAAICGMMAQTNPARQGWDALLKNDDTNAREYFNKGVQDPATKAESLLGLTMLNYEQKKKKEALDNFIQFYDATPNPYAYLYALSSWTFLYETHDELAQQREKFFERIVQDPKMDGTLKALLYERIGDYYEYYNQQSKSLDWYKKMGTINNWQVLGTFDNTSGSGFNKDWGAISKPMASDVFKNKVDAEVKWFTPKSNKPNNWFTFDYYFVFDDVIMYAQSFVNSPSDQDVYLRVGTSGSLKVWVNDALVMSVTEERNCDLDIYPCKVSLKKGNNRILVQIGQSDIEAGNFMLRLTDENANPVPGLTSSSEYTDYPKASAPAKTELLPFFAEDFFQKKIAESPENPVNKILLGNVYLRNDKAYEATKVLKPLQDEVPNSYFVSELMSEAYLRAKNNTDYTKEEEKIKQVAPNSYTALSLKYQEAIKSEKYTDAADICKKAVELYGESETTENWELSIASYEKRMQDMIEIINKMSEKYPADYDYMYYNYLIQKNASKNGNKAKAVVESFSKKYFSKAAMDLLSDIYFDEGNYKKGLQILIDRIAKMPYATGYMESLMYKYYQLQRYDEALAVSDQMLKLSPYIASIYNSRGYILQNLNRIDEAKENFQKSIYYKPTSYDSRTQLRLLNKKEELHTLFPKVDMDQIVTGAPTDKDYPQDNSVVLLNDNQLIVYPEQAQETRCELAVKVLNQSGVQNWKDYTISYNSNTQKLIVDKAEIIKANGTRAKAETDNDNSIVFTNLEVNDVIHLEYRIQNYAFGKIARHFSDNFSFQYSIPSKLNRYSILAPKDRTFNYQVANGNIIPAISDIEDMKLYTWEMKDMPAIKQEPLMSNMSDIVPTLYYSSIPDWKFVSNWYKDITTSKFQEDYVLKETVNTLLKGKENASPIEKAKIFYNYILDNITYSNVSFLQSNYIPQKASRTITTRLGDCKDMSTLFVALCNEVGIDANLVLISTRNNGNKTMPLPSINFNHCIAQLNVDGKKMYLELTNNTLPFGAASEYDLNSEILPIPFKVDNIGDKLVTFEMPFRPKNEIKRINTLTITDNNFKIKRTTMYMGVPAADRRDTYRFKGEEEQLKTMNEAVASDFTVPVKVTDLKLINLDNLKDTVSMSCTIDVTGVLQDVVNMKIFKLPWTEKFGSLDVVNADTRNYPIEFWKFVSADQHTEIINIVLTGGKKFMEMPKDVNLDCSCASYKLSFVQNANGTITATRFFAKKKDQVGKDEYATFKAFLQKVTESDNKQYAIQ